MADRGSDSSYFLKLVQRHYLPLSRSFALGHFESRDSSNKRVESSQNERHSYQAEKSARGRSWSDLFAKESAIEVISALNLRRYCVTLTAFLGLFSNAFRTRKRTLLLSNT
jgi:hypothetical protein